MIVSFDWVFLDREYSAVDVLAGDFRPVSFEAIPKEGLSFGCNPI